MSNADNSSIFKVLFDCFFACTGRQLRKFNEKHKKWGSLVKDITTLLVQLTIISMMVAGGSHMFVESQAIRCGYSSYQTAWGSKYLLVVAIPIIVLELLCRSCLDQMYMPLARLLAIFLYILGIGMMFELLRYDNSTFCATIKDTQLHTWNQQGTTETPPKSKEKVLYISCPLSRKHCAMQFLTTELIALTWSCRVTWLIGTIICCRFLINLYFTRATCLQTPSTTRDPSSIRDPFSSAQHSSDMSIAMSYASLSRINPCPIGGISFVNPNIEATWQAPLGQHRRESTKSETSRKSSYSTRAGSKGQRSSMSS